MSSSSSAVHEPSAIGTLVGRDRVPHAQLPLDLPRDVHRAELRPAHGAELGALEVLRGQCFVMKLAGAGGVERQADRKSTRLNSSHMSISYAVFCLKKKKKNKE